MLSKQILTNINRYNQYKPTLINVLYSLNKYRLVSVNISKGTFFNHEKSEPILTNINQYLQ